MEHLESIKNITTSEILITKWRDQLLEYIHSKKYVKDLNEGDLEIVPLIQFFYRMKLDLNCFQDFKIDTCKIDHNDGKIRYHSAKILVYLLTDPDSAREYIKELFSQKNYDEGTDPDYLYNYIIDKASVYASLSGCLIDPLSIFPKSLGTIKFLTDCVLNTSNLPDSILKYCETLYNSGRKREMYQYLENFMDIMGRNSSQIEITRNFLNKKITEKLNFKPSKDELFGKLSKSLIKYSNNNNKPESLIGDVSDMLNKYLSEFSSQEINLIIRATISQLSAESDYSDNKIEYRYVDVLQLIRKLAEIFVNKNPDAHEKYYSIIDTFIDKPIFAEEFVKITTNKYPNNIFDLIESDFILPENEILRLICLAIGHDHLYLIDKLSTYIDRFKHPADMQAAQLLVHCYDSNEGTLNILNLLNNMQYICSMASFKERKGVKFATALINLGNKLFDKSTLGDLVEFVKNNAEIKGNEFVDELKKELMIYCFKNIYSEDCQRFLIEMNPEISTILRNASTIPR